MISEEIKEQYREMRGEGVLYLKLGESYTSLEGDNPLKVVKLPKKRKFVDSSIRCGLKWGKKETRVLIRRWSRGDSDIKITRLLKRSKQSIEDRRYRIGAVRPRKINGTSVDLLKIEVAKSLLVKFKD